ncbi:MAG: recombinase family protein [Clostridia bacterium]|nr:recombinase family protein [Clostridia bacterium]
MIRVAAYCRFSTDSEDQANAFLAQVRYYSDFIQSQENMLLVDIYADEGITGTCMNKRKDFKRLIYDCSIGRIDRIYVKSVSRFSRNSLECIETIRKLKEC